MFVIEEELKKLPDQPGVYIMHDSRDAIIYIGKAVSLRKRVHQYFQPSHDEGIKKAQMVKQIARFEYIVTDSELEALVLECNLIKEHRPKYNTMLRDDKTYPYIRVTLGEDFPRVLFSRQQKKDKSRYFGPYTSAGAVKDTIELVNKIYQLRTCNRNLPRDTGKDRPCLNYHIHQCTAPCQGYITKEAYRERVDAVVEFLNGNYAPVLKSLEEKMNTASANLEFEKAIEYRELLNSVRQIAQKNAKMVLAQDREKIKREEGRTIGALKEIEQLLDMKGLNRVEAYDISNTSGFESVGSMIVYEKGKPKRSDYRKFKLRTVSGPDDYASMYEVLTRRFTHGMREMEEMEEKDLSEEYGSFTRFPDLIMMDGGRGQVNIALKVLEELHLNIPVCGMVKDDNHRTRGLYYHNVEIPIDRGSEGFKLITRIQDEAHRFAIEYHRSLRSKEQVHSVLDDIPDIGPARRKALMKKYQSLEAIREATEEDLAQTDSMSPQAARSVYRFFREKERENQPSD